MLDVLRSPTFRRLFAAQVVALVGTGLLTVALGLLAYDLAGGSAGAVLGTALAIKMVAYVGVAPVIAVVVAGLPKRAVLVGADVVRAGVALLLPWVSEVWQIYVLVLVLQAASATFTPAFQSLIPSVLTDEDEYTRGLSLSRLAYDLEAVLSPLLAAVALLFVSYSALFAGTVAGFVGSALLVLRTSLPALPPPDRSQPFLARVMRGANVMWERPVLRSLLAMNLAVAAATGVVVVNTVVYVRDLLGSNDIGVAIALGCFGAGSMAVALALPRLLTQVPDRLLMLGGCAVASLGLAALSVLLLADPGRGNGWLVLGVTWLVLGAGTSLVNTPSARLLRYQTDESERSSVFTAQFSLSHACYLLTYPLAGWAGARLGHVAAAVALTLLATLAWITATRLWPARLPATQAATTG